MNLWSDKAPQIHHQKGIYISNYYDQMGEKIIYESDLIYGTVIQCDVSFIVNLVDIFFQY